ncbi:putative ribonuclease H-like domain-containing protein [Tanacetum coccineum]
MKFHHHHHINIIITKTPTQTYSSYSINYKRPILKKGEYDIWAMKMEHYLALTDYPIWEVIQNRNGPVSITTDTSGQIKLLPPRTAEEIVARERERKARTTLLMALPEDHLAKFHKMTDEKEMWDAIKSRFGRNDESKKMQKYILKQQFEGFSVSNTKGLHKGYGRTKPGVDSLSFDDLYNNLRVFESDVKGSTASSSPQNVAFVFENTNSTNDVSTAYCVPNPSGQNSQHGLEVASGDDLNENEKVLQEDWRRDALNSGTKDGSKTGQKEDSKALREQLSDASIEIKAYSQGLKKVEAQLVAHQQGQLWYEQKIKFMKIDLDDKTDVLTYHKKLLAEAQKEKEDLKAKVEKWHNSSKNLSKLLNTQMSANDKFGLGYGDHRYDGILSNENEVLHSVFMNKESELEKQHLYDRFVTADGMHVVPPPMTGNYIPFGSDIEVVYSQFTYVSEPVVNESNIECQPKVWSDAPIIEEYESDSEDEETVKNQFTHSQKPKVDKTELGQREIRPIWNNVQRVNHQNQFVPTAILTITGKIPVNTARASGTKNVSTARHSFNRQAVLTSAAMKVNTVKPIVNIVRPTTVFHKTHSPFSKPSNKTTALRTNFSKQKVNTAKVNAVSDVGGKRETAVKPTDYPHRALQNKGIVDSGCSRHMTGNKAYLAEYQDFNGGPVAFGGSKGYITGKGKIKTGKLDFEDVCFVKELQHFNLFSVSQMCDKKNKVLFTDSECLVLSPEFKLPDANQVLLRIPRQNNMYSFNLENIVPSGGLACLIAKATIDESNKWHRRLGHVNFKNLNKLVKGNLVRGLPLKIFQNDHTCVACQKGKQHKASCKAKSVSSISHSLQLLHMDLFGPTSVRSLNHKTYCLVITDDFSRFSWVFFLRTKDETSGILKDFIRQIENQLNQKVKTIRCDNGTEFKNRDFIEFCGSKGIKREYSNARTPQQNGVAERKNRTLIEAARTMLADSFLPNTFWAEAVSTACYVLNRVLVTKPHNKTPYELVTGKGPTWLFDLDYLTDSMNYHPVRSENQANIHAGQQEANHHAGTEDIIDAGDSKKEDESAQDCFVLPIWPSYSSTIPPGLKTDEKREGPREEEQVFLDELERLKRQEKEANEEAEALRKEFAQETKNLVIKEGAAKASSTNIFSVVSTPAKASSTNLVNTVSIPVSTANPNEGLSISFCPTKS